MTTIAASPVSTDFVLDGESPYPGLVRLDYVKKLLGLTGATDDVFLQSQIIWLSERVEEYCVREFKVKDYVYLRSIALGCGPSGTLTTGGSYYQVGDLRAPAQHCVRVEGYPVTKTHSILIDGTELTATEYELDAKQGLYVSPCFTRALEEIQISYEAGFDPVPFSVAQAVADLVMGRYYSKGSDPSRIVRAENVPDVANVSYLSSVYYQADYDPILGQYGTLLDTYRTERALGFDAEVLFTDEACPW